MVFICRTPVSEVLKYRSNADGLCIVQKGPYAVGLACAYMHGTAWFLMQCAAEHIC